jgi:hypothetical protein
MRAAAEKVLQELIRWAKETGLSPAHQRALHLAALPTCPDWAALLREFRRHPALLLRPRAYAAVLKWATLRQHPDDPFLPGLFPARRRTIRSAR